MLAFEKVSMDNALGNVIRTARKQRKLTQGKVAAEMKVTYQAVGQWERGENEITMANLRKLSAFLGIDSIAATRGELVFTSPDIQLNEVQQVSDGSSLPDRGPKDVPVLGASYGSADADFEMNGTVVDHVRRPEGIAKVKDVFALHVLGSSMSPRYEPGDLVYCGGRPPVPGDDVVIEMMPEADEQAGKGYIKRLLGRSGGSLRCQQFNPQETLTFSLSDVKHVHRVIPYKELLGF